jgi:serine protease Do
VRVDLDSFEPAVKAADRTKKVRESGLDRLGFSAAELTESLARRMRLEARDGVVIARVDESGPAARAGLRPGMVIERFNGKDVDSLKALEKAADAVRPGEAVSLVVRLSDGTQTIINFRARG